MPPGIEYPFEASEKNSKKMQRHLNRFVKRHMVWCMRCEMMITQLLNLMMCFFKKIV